MIDFSQPEGTMAVLPTCIERRIPLVVATTGHTPAQRQEIEAAAHQTAVLMAPNMSLAVNVLMKLVGQAAAVLRDKGFDVEILERHHRFKKDSPSGTALALRQDRSGRDGPNRTASRPRRAGRRTAGITRSASMPSASATTSASIPSSSARSAKRWS